MLYVPVSLVLVLCTVSWLCVASASGSLSSLRSIKLNSVEPAERQKGP